MNNKVICLLLSIILCVIALISCSSDGNDDNKQKDSVSSDSGYKRPTETVSPEDTKWGDTLDEPGEVAIHDRGTHDYVIGSWAGCTWGSMFYFMQWRTPGIWYQDVNNIQRTKLPLYNDALADGSGDPFVQLDDACILVDEKATINNSGVPVLIIAGTFPIGYSEETGIVYKGTAIGSFDTLTNKWTVIKDDIEGDALQMVMYHDTIFFVTFAGEGEGYVINRINRDGSGYSKMKNDEAAYINLGWIHNDTIYCLDKKTYSVYSCNLDFSERQFLFDGASTIENVTDDHIYYSVENPDVSFDLYRRSLTNISKSELVLKNSWGNFYRDVYYYTASLGEDGTYILFSYDLTTDETKTVYDITGERDKILKNVYTYGDTYLICQFFNLGDNNDGSVHYTCMDLISGKEWLIPN